MKRFTHLKIEGKEFSTNKEIVYQLSLTPFSWILDCELENVSLEIKDNILYFNSGIFYWGYWKWGVFKSGEFRSGIWEGGIFLDGLFKGQYKKIVFKGGIMKGKQI